MVVTKLLGYSHTQLLVTVTSTVPAGQPVSYGATWAPATDTRVVTVPIGYGDGFPRALSSRGQVLVRGQRHPIVGRICMDQFMADIGPQGTAYNEDAVVLIGRQGDQAIAALSPWGESAEPLRALARFIVARNS